MKNFIQILLCLFFLESCTSKDLSEEILNIETDKISEFTVIMPQFQTDGLYSRSDITMGEYPNISSKWADGDSIGIFPNVGDQLSFRITASGDGKNCTFDGGGWALKPSSFYTAYSPFKRSYYYKKKNELLISMLGQKQQGTSTGHLGAYDVKVATGTKPANGGISFVMQRKVALVRMDLTAPTAASWKTIKVQCYEPVFTSEAIMDLTSETPVITPVSMSRTLTLELENVKTTESNKNITAYMMMLPVDLTDESADVYLTDNNGNIYNGDFEVINNKKKISANTARWVKETNFQKWGKSFSVEKAGTLATIIPDEDKYTVTSMKVIGELNGDDIALLRKMMASEEYRGQETGLLENLDLSEASIVEGGGCYYKNFSTSDNTVGESMFSECYHLKYIELPDNCKSIGDKAFFGCNKLNIIRLPNSVTSIGESVFACCSFLWICIFPDNVTTIPKNSFLNTPNFSGFAYSTSTTTIEDGAFYGSRFNRFTLHENVTYIGDKAFAQSNIYNDYLEAFICESSIPPTLGNNVFTTPRYGREISLYVPKGCVEIYRKSDWSTYFTDIRESQ